MKRHVGVVALVVVVALMVVSAGCGQGNREIAQQYMVQGDRGYSAAEMSAGELQQTLEKAESALGTGDSQQIAQAASDLEGFEQKANGYVQQLQTALDRYNKIGTLSGVEVYLPYEEMMSDAINLDVEAAKEAGRLVADIAPSFEQAAAGQPVDLSATLAEFQEGLAEVEQKMDSAEKLVKEARAYKTGNNLAGE